MPPSSATPVSLLAHAGLAEAEQPQRAAEHPIQEPELEREPEGQVVNYGVDVRQARGAVEHAPEVGAGAPPVAALKLLVGRRSRSPLVAALPGPPEPGHGPQAAGPRQRVLASTDLAELDRWIRRTAVIRAARELHEVYGGKIPCRERS